MTVALASPPTDGTDAGALPVADQEKRWLGLTATGWQRLLAPVAIGAVVLLAALVFIFWRRVPARHLVGGALIGLLVPLGYLVTAGLGGDEFEPATVESINVTRGGGDSLIYLLTWTGSKINFGIAFVGGVLVGAVADLGDKTEAPRLRVSENTRSNNSPARNLTPNRVKETRHEHQHYCAQWHSCRQGVALPHLPPRAHSAGLLRERRGNSLRLLSLEHADGAVCGL